MLADGWLFSGGWNFSFLLFASIEETTQNNNHCSDRTADDENYSIGFHLSL
ncbi:hypothetical protein HanIR_Chr12g0589051 [Helianthus annuus]|nr:hypothetical protein HanIR_Chr12g0589051 [Helianthus annuus]